MKDLANLANAERLSDSQDVFWLFEVDWPDATRRYATRPLNLEGVEWVARIEGIERQARAADVAEIPPTHLASERATVRLSNRRGETDRIEDLVRRFDPEGLACRIRLFFRDTAGAASANDIVEVFAGRIATVRLAAANATFEAIDILSFAVARTLGRLIDSRSFPLANPAILGQPAPWIFGRALHAPLLPLTDSASTRLRDRLDPDDTIVAADTLEGFPESGTIQVGDERIVYSRLDEAGLTFGAAASPVLRPAPALHGAGTRIRFLPLSGFDFIAADHECLSFSDARADGAILDPSTYSLGLTQAGGRAVQVVNFPRWPTRVIASPSATRFTLRGDETTSNWKLLTDNTALAPLAATDSDPSESSASLSSTQPRLALSFQRNLESWERRRGPMAAVRLAVRFWADRLWQTSTRIEARVSKGGASIAVPLPRPETASLSAQTAPHSHQDSILDTVEDARPLFEGEEILARVEFDSAEGENAEGGSFRWPDSRMAIDGLFDTTTFSFGGGAESNMLPLTLRVNRLPQSDDAAALREVAFHARLRSGDGMARPARLTLSIPGKAEVALDETAGVSFETFATAHRSEELFFSDLTQQGTCCRIQAPDGGRIEVAEAWLEIRWRLKLRGQEQSLLQRRTGQVMKAGALSVGLPAPMQTYEIDLSPLAAAHGQWRFFSGDGGWPEVRVELQGPGEEAVIHIADLAWVFDARPRQEARMAERVTATLEGVPFEGASTGNPADAIAFLLTDSRAGGLDPAMVDWESVAAAREALEARSWRFEARFDRVERIETLLASALFESRLELRMSGGKVQLGLEPASSAPSEAIESFEAAGLLDPLLPRRRTDGGVPLQALTLLYAPDFSRPAARRHQTDRREALAGADTEASNRREAVIRGRWLGDVPASVARELALHHLALRAERRWIATLDTPLRGIHLDLGDPVALSRPFEAIAPATGRIVGWSADALHRIRFEVELQPESESCWSHEGQTFLRHLAGGLRLEIHIAGQEVARLERGGRLVLRGRVIEDSLESLALPAPIEWHWETGWLCLGFGAEGAFEAGLAFTPQGDLMLRGRVEERAAIEAPDLADCYAASPDSIALGSGGMTVEALYDAVGRILRLRGEVEEEG